MVRLPCGTPRQLSGSVDTFLQEHHGHAGSILLSQESGLFLLVLTSMAASIKLMGLHCCPLVPETSHQESVGSVLDFTNKRVSRQTLNSSQQGIPLKCVSQNIQISNATVCLATGKEWLRNHAHGRVWGKDSRSAFCRLMSLGVPRYPVQTFASIH